MTKPSKKKCFLITTGGTGGHIFPAQALSEALIKRGHHVIEVIDQRAVKYVAASSQNKVFILHLAHGKGLLKKLRLGIDLVWAFFRSLYIINKTKPAAIMGFGGYTTFPVILAAFLLRKPFILHEQNSFVGRVTKWFAPFAAKISTCFLPLYGLPSRYESKLVWTGNPLRASIKAITQKLYKPFESGSPIRLLIIGGSQGAKSFSTLIPQALELLSPSFKKRLEVIQQVPAYDLDNTKMAYEKMGIKATLQPFFHHIHEEYRKADLVIARAGASTVMELEAVGRPVIFIPFPYAMDDHQTYNARNIIEHEAGWMVKESAALPSELGALIENLLSHPKMLEKAAKKIHHLAKLDADTTLATLLELL